MDSAKLKDRGISLLRLITNSCIDKDAAELLLDGEPLETILDLQTVMLIGIVSEEREEDTLSNPEETYKRCRERTKVIGDYYEEIQYLLQPEYKYYLIRGMRVLGLR